MKTIPERGLWRRVALGDEPARQEMTRRYLPLVRRLARNQYRKLARGSLLELDDLISWGTIGLIQSLDGFRPDAGFKFATFARRRILGAILDALREMDWVPRSARLKHRAGGEQPAQMVPLQLPSDPDAAASDVPRVEYDAGAGIDAEEFWHHVTRGMKRLERRLILSYHREGLTLAKAAARCGLNESQAGTLLGILNERVRAQLSGRERW